MKKLPIFRVLAIGALALLTAGAAAQSMEEAMSAFTSGDFLAAADIGEAVGTSDSFALAARALGVYGNFLAPESRRIAILERAIELAESAVTADSLNPEAYYQSAHVVGRYAENTGKMKALREGLAGRIRDLLEHAIELDPDFAEAHVALAGWHAEIVAAGRLARWMYKGGRDEALFHFDRALEIAPDSKVILFEYGKRIADLDPDNGTARARELLTRARERPVLDKSDEILQGEILAALAQVDNE